MTEPTPEDTMTEYQELAARLRAECDVRDQYINDFDEHLTADMRSAASAIEALEAERDEARLKFATLQDMNEQALDTGLVISALDHAVTAHRAEVSEARCKRLEAQVEQAFRDGLAYATNVVVTDADEAWRTSRARLAQETKP